MRLGDAPGAGADIGVIAAARGDAGLIDPVARAGHVQDTASGVSPHPSAVFPLRSATVTQVRRQTTLLVTSDPNFSGTLKVTGRK